MCEGLDEITEMMETLLEEYEQQESQLDKMQSTLSHLKYGYNSLRHQISKAECAASERVADIGLGEHIAESTASVEEINECLEQSEDSLDVIESIVHPCGEGEWRLVVNDRYSNPTADDCPSGWEEFIDATTTRRFCGRDSSDFSVDQCDSASFAVGDGECVYSKVCGKIVAYGHGENTAFSSASSGSDIDTFYVNGLIITHGDPLQHIWTLAIGAFESPDDGTSPETTVCPCHPHYDADMPLFVGSDYFCESGSENEGGVGHHLGDPLWDERQCHEDCCIGSPFVKTLANGPTTDPLEIRICNVAGVASGNILVEEIKIYVQ